MKKFLSIIVVAAICSSFTTLPTKAASGESRSAHLLNPVTGKSPGKGCSIKKTKNVNYVQKTLGKLCFFIYDDVSTYCKKWGISTGVTGRRWAVYYECYSGMPVLWWEI